MPYLFAIVFFTSSAVIRATSADPCSSVRKWLSNDLISSVSPPQPLLSAVPRKFCKNSFFLIKAGSSISSSRGDRVNSALSSFGLDNSVKIASVLITSFKPVYSGFLFHKLLLRQDTCFLSLNGLPTRGLRLSPSFQIKERRALRFGTFPTSLSF